MATWEWFWELILNNRTILYVISSLVAILGTIRYLPQLVRFLRVLGHVIVQGKNKLRLGREIELFWRDFVKQPLVVVIPPRDIDDEITGTQSFDYLGKDHLIDELTDVFGLIERRRVFADDINENEMSSNIISVAGPIPNMVTGLLLTQPEIAYRFRAKSSDGSGPTGRNEQEQGEVRFGHEIVKARSDDAEILVEPVYSTKTETISRDYGIITFAKNPYDDSYDIVNVAGGFGHGTHAGFKLLTNSETLRYLRKHGEKYFQVIYTVKLDSEGNIGQPYLLDRHPDPDIRQETLVKLYKDSK